METSQNDSMNVFVTGGTGLLGIHLINRLLAEGFKVYSLVRPDSNTGPIEKRGGIEFIVGDILNLSGVPKLDGIGVFIHTAARTDFPRERQIISENYRINVSGTANVLELACRSGAGQFIYVSSCSVMGDCYDGERDESFPPNPDSIYGKSKYEAEKIVCKYHQEGRIRTSILRPGLMYGPYDRSGLIKMVEYVDKGKSIILGNGKNYKSPVSVHNVVEAILCMINNPKSFGELFIVTDGKNYAINEIFNEIARLLGRKGGFLHLPAQLSLTAGRLADLINKIPGIELPVSSADVKKFLSNNTYDIKKIKTTLNYMPKYFLSDGLQEIIDWYKKRE